MTDSIAQLVEQLNNLRSDSEGVVLEGVALWISPRTQHVPNDLDARAEDYSKRVFQMTEGSFRIGRENNGAYFFMTPSNSLNSGQINYFEQTFSVDAWRADTQYEGLTLMATGKLNGAPFELAILQKGNPMFSELLRMSASLLSKLEPIAKP